MARDEIWDILKASTKRRAANWKANNMRFSANIDDGKWVKHTDYHWSRDVDGNRLDYWPSTKKYQFCGKIKQGDPRKVYEAST